MKTEPNDSIHPANVVFEDGKPTLNDGIGLTKREHFAVMAMQGLLANMGNIHKVTDLAEHAVDAADALIAALNKD